MSLINQMLKDLDARRADAGSTGFAPLPGIALAEREPSHRMAMLASWTGGAALLAIAALYGVQNWHARERLQADDPPAATVLATPPAALPLDVPPTAASVRTEPQVAPPAAPVEPFVVHPEATAPTPASAPTPVRPEPKPIKTVTPKQQAEGLLAQAEQALENHQADKGELLLRQALFVDPLHAGVRIRLAAVLSETGRPAAAERLLLQGLEEHAGSPGLSRAYAQQLAARGALDEALAALEAAAPAGAGDAEWQALRAAILYRLKRHAEAAEAYQRALYARPDEALWWTGLAIAREHNGEARAAVQAYRRAARLPLDGGVRDYVNQRLRALHATDGP